MSSGAFGLKNLPLSVFAIILNLKPIMIILLGFCYGIETFTLKKVILILISFFGASLIVNPDFFARLFNQVMGNQVEQTAADDHIEKGTSLLGSKF